MQATRLKVCEHQSPTRPDAETAAHNVKRLKTRSTTPATTGHRPVHPPSGGIHPPPAARRPGAAQKRGASKGDHDARGASSYLTGEPPSEGQLQPRTPPPLGGSTALSTGAAGGAQAGSRPPDASSEGVRGGRPILE